MAGRKDKNTVDYFPHYCISGKTLFIIENKFSHLGYAVWFKTLELLGSSENHYIDLRNETDLLYLISKLKITEDQFNNIYNLFSKLGAIDSFLWSKKIIFSENFIKNIEDAYKRRNNLCMHKYDLCKHLSIKCNNIGKKGIQKPTKESKVYKSKEEEIKETGKYICKFHKHLSITEEKYYKLINEYGNKIVNDKIDAIDNRAKSKDYKDLNLTLRQWLKNEKKIDNKMVY